MVTKFLAAIFILLITFSACQSVKNPKKILAKSYKTCQAVKQGHYQMGYKLKYMTHNDTTSYSYFCDFKKNLADSIFDSRFHYTVYSGDKYQKDVLYTGKAFVSYSVKDSSGGVMPVDKNTKSIKSISHNHKFYDPLVDLESYPLPDSAALTNGKYIFKNLGIETLMNKPVYHIQQNELPDNDSDDGVLKVIRSEVHYWIDKKDFIPLRYTVAYDVVMNRDTMYQFEQKTLEKYVFEPIDNSKLSMAIISDYIKLKDYKPFKEPELLKINTPAPAWSLKDLEGHTVTLSDYKGKLVLLDFFYKSCYPCMLALPDLQALHRQFAQKGLSVIGIDPVDKNDHNNLSRFLNKRQVQYKVVLGNDKVVKDYHVSSYPTLYLIDTTGKIIYTQIGYSKKDFNELKKLIKRNLP